MDCDIQSVMSLHHCALPGSPGLAASDCWQAVCTELSCRGGLARALCEKKAECYSATSYQHCQRYEDATSPHSTLGRRCFHEVKSQLLEASVGRGEGPFRGVAALSPALPGSCGCL